MHLCIASVFVQSIQISAPINLCCPSVLADSPPARRCAPRGSSESRHLSPEARRGRLQQWQGHHAQEGHHSLHLPLSKPLPWPSNPPTCILHHHFALHSPSWSHPSHLVPQVSEAFNLIRDLEPSTPQEYILKGVVHASLGQQKESQVEAAACVSKRSGRFRAKTLEDVTRMLGFHIKLIYRPLFPTTRIVRYSSSTHSHCTAPSPPLQEHLKTAQQYFQMVGASASECDTIPGRQCMASCFFLLKQFDDVLVFLSSIRSYFPNDDDFNW